jgi:hypothetical protein
MDTGFEPEEPIFIQTKPDAAGILYHIFIPFIAVRQ